MAEQPHLNPNEIPARPVCPHCGLDPVNIACAQIHMGPLVSMTYFCANPSCRRLLAISFMGMNPTQNRVVLPGGMSPSPRNN